MAIIAKYLVRKITFKQILEVFFQYVYKVLEQYWDNLFERNFAGLGYAFTHCFNWASYVLQD